MGADGQLEAVDHRQHPRGRVDDAALLAIVRLRGFSFELP